MHLSERTGKGNPLIVSRYGRGAFEITDSSVKVTLPYNWKRNFEEPVDKLVDKPVDKLADKLSETEKRILEVLAKHPDFSQPKIAELAGVGKTTVQTAIAKFKESGFVVRVGSNKDGHWEILKKDN